MAQPTSTPRPPRLSIARLAELWDTGLSEARFIDFAVGCLVTQYRDCSYLVFNAGVMSLREYLENLDDWGHGRHDLTEWGYRQIAEEVMLGPADVVALEAAFGVPLPARLAAWASATASPERQRGRPTRRDEIVAEYNRFDAAERGSSHEAQAALIRERLGGGAMLSDTAIFRALSWRK